MTAETQPTLFDSTQTPETTAEVLATETQPLTLFDESDFNDYRQVGLRGIKQARDAQLKAREASEARRKAEAEANKKRGPFADQVRRAS